MKKSGKLEKRRNREFEEELGSFENFRNVLKIEKKSGI